MQFIDLKTQSERIESQLFARFKAIIDRSSYIMGPEVLELQSALASFVGVEHALGVSSGTDALLIALMALDIGPNDEVITSPFSFFATAEVIMLLGAKPVFVDINPVSYMIEADAIERAITEKTKAIMPVSLYGQCADFTAINALATRHQLPVIEDAAQSFGALHHGRHSCALTTVGCTSFFPSKPLGAYGDAGACFTNDPELAKRMQEIRLHGQSARYYHTRLGINGRVDTFQAAVLLEKLNLFAEEIELRQAVAARYDAWLPAGVKRPTISPGNKSVYAQYTIEVVEREEIQQALNERGIPTAVHYPLGLHQQPSVQAYLGNDNQHLPATEHAAAVVMSLPMSPYLTEQDQRRVIEALHEVLADEMAVC